MGVTTRHARALLTDPRHGVYTARNPLHRFNLESTTTPHPERTRRRQRRTHTHSLLATYNHSSTPAIARSLPTAYLLTRATPPTGLLLCALICAASIPLSSRRDAQHTTPASKTFLKAGMQPTPSRANCKDFPEAKILPPRAGMQLRRQQKVE